MPTLRIDNSQIWYIRGNMSYGGRLWNRTTDMTNDCVVYFVCTKNKTSRQKWLCWWLQKKTYNFYGSSEINYTYIRSNFWMRGERYQICPKISARTHIVHDDEIIAHFKGLKVVNFLYRLTYYKRSLKFKFKFKLEPLSFGEFWYFKYVKNKRVYFWTIEYLFLYNLNYK